MGAIEDLVAGLLGAPAQKAIAEENTYYKLGAVPDALSGSIQQIASQAPGRFSTKDLLIGSLLTGLTGGIFKGLGDTYQNTLTDRSLRNTNSLLRGDTSNSEGVSPSLFRANQDAVRMFQTRKGLEDAQAETDAKRLVEKQIDVNAANAIIENPRQADKIISAVGTAKNKLLGTALPAADSSIAAPVAVQADTVQKLGATDSTLPSNSEASPNDPSKLSTGESIAVVKPASPKTLSERLADRIKWYEENSTYNDKEILQAAKQDVQKASEVELDIQKKINDSEPAQNLQVVLTQVGNLESALKQSNPSSAAVAIYSLAKILDPKSTVRESDYTILADPGSPALKLNSLLSNLRGKGPLTETQKNNIRSLIPGLVESPYSSYKSYANTLLPAVERLGGSKDNISLYSIPSFNIKKSVDLSGLTLEQLQAEKARRGAAR